MEKEDVWNVLVRFHNEVAMPDFRRAIGDAFDEKSSPRFSRVDKALDALAVAVHALRDEVYALRAALNS